MKRGLWVVLICAATVLIMSGAALAAGVCVDCHSNISPGQVRDWEASKHSEMGVSCDTCHGDAHKMPPITKTRKCRMKALLRMSRRAVHILLPRQAQLRLDLP